MTCYNIETKKVAAQPVNSNTENHSVRISSGPKRSQAMLFIGRALPECETCAQVPKKYIEGKRLKHPFEFSNEQGAMAMPGIQSGPDVAGCHCVQLPARCPERAARAAGSCTAPSGQLPGVTASAHSDSRLEEAAAPACRKHCVGN